MTQDNDNYGTPQQYMAKYSVKKNTFYSQVRRGQIVFNARGFVDYFATRANLRRAGRPKISNTRKRMRVNWTVRPEEYQELFKIHAAHRLRHGASIAKVRGCRYFEDEV
jgi:hypothetical protein